MRCRGPVIALLAAAALSACGEETITEVESRTTVRTATPAATTVAQPARKPRPKRKRVRYKHCLPAGQVTGGPLVVCRPRINSRGHGWFTVAGRGLELGTPFPWSDTAVGHWDWAAASPDGRTILAQWRGECEVPLAFFIPADGGSPQSVTGSYSQKRLPPNSTAYGWTTDGRAIVFVPNEPAGASTKPGVFLIDSAARRTRIADVEPMERPDLTPSLRPRSVEAVRRAFS